MVNPPVFYHILVPLNSNAFLSTCSLVHLVKTNDDHLAKHTHFGLFVYLLAVDGRRPLEPSLLRLGEGATVVLGEILAARGDLSFGSAAKKKRKCLLSVGHMIHGLNRSPHSDIHVCSKYHD